MILVLCSCLERIHYKHASSNENNELFDKINWKLKNTNSSTLFQFLLKIRMTNINLKIVVTKQSKTKRNCNLKKIMAHFFLFWIIYLKLRFHKTRERASTRKCTHQIYSKKPQFYIIDNLIELVRWSQLLQYWIPEMSLFCFVWYLHLDCFQDFASPGSTFPSYIWVSRGGYCTVPFRYLKRWNKNNFLFVK